MWAITHAVHLLKAFLADDEWPLKGLHIEGGDTFIFILQGIIIHATNFKSLQASHDQRSPTRRGPVSEVPRGFLGPLDCSRRLPHNGIKLYSGPTKVSQKILVRSILDSYGIYKALLSLSQTLHLTHWLPTDGVAGFFPSTLSTLDHRFNMSGSN